MKPWRRRLRLALNGPRCASPTGFSQYSSYVEAKGLKEMRETREAATRLLQRVSRGAAKRLEARERLHRVIVLQAFARRRSARVRALWWRRALGRLRAVRAQRLQWQAFRGATQGLLPLQTHAVLVQLHVCKEILSVQARLEHLTC